MACKLSFGLFTCPLVHFAYRNQSAVSRLKVSAKHPVWVQPAVVEDPKELALRTETRQWLLKHGYPLPVGRLTKRQADEIKECFEVLDGDRSGTLDLDELQAAFTMLGFRVSAPLTFLQASHCSAAACLCTSSP